MSDEMQGHLSLQKFTSLEEILDREGLREEVTLRAFKKLLARRIVDEMENQSLTKSDMARRMGTSRAQLDRVLDPNAYNVTIETIVRAARTLGKRLVFDLA